MGVWLTHLLARDLTITYLPAEVLVVLEEDLLVLDLAVWVVAPLILDLVILEVVVEE